MKQYIKVISFLLAAVLLASFATVVTYAVDEPTITVSSAEGSVGKTVDIDIALINNPGIICAMLTVDFDSSALELVAVNDTGLLPGQVHTPDFSSPYTLTWMNSTVTEDYTVEGTIVTLQFRIKETATVGNSYKIVVSYDYDNYEIFNFNFDPIAFNIQNGSVTIVCPHNNTTDVPETPANCTDSGYTAGVYCNDCEQYISGHEFIPATGQHIDDDGEWEVDEEHHFRTCATCGDIFDLDSHGGGAATCYQKAICSVCKTEYGTLNAENHAGGTTIINASEPDHKTQTAGYTGDTKCLGCGEILAYGSVIEPGAHTSSDAWAGNDTHHWKECDVVGCGVMIDGSKAPHVSTGSHVATCEKKAVCDVCGAFYGDYAAHQYTAETKNADALKSEGTCRDEAVYYYSCSVCGNVEKDDNHTFNGGKDANNHVGGTTVVNASEPDHETQTAGYTGDTKCLGCGEILAYGSVIEPDAHTPADVWSSDDTHHWKECNVGGCGIVIDGSKAPHTSTGSNVATCQKAAVCDVCQSTYGSVADHDWSNEWKSDATGHWHACNTLGCTETNSFENHTPDHQGGATEEYPIQCTVCGYIMEAQLGHTHVYDQEIATDAYKATDATCEEMATYYKSCKCGEKGSDTFAFGELAEHTWEEATCTKPQTCTVCGEVLTPAKGHTEVIDPAKEATCTETGLTEGKHCSVCNEVLVEQKVVPVKPHTPGDEATCTKPQTCTVCGEVLAPAKGHDYVKGVCTRCGAEDPDYRPLGDINNDGNVDARDYMLLKRYVLGTYGLTDEQKAVADINHDGKINALDYALLKRHVLGTYQIA